MCVQGGTIAVRNAPQWFHPERTLALGHAFIAMFGHPIGLYEKTPQVMLGYTDR